ncbi:uncharacterized protein METZ01_LOCUS135372, partial [marine metagenome]
MDMPHKFIVKLIRNIFLNLLNLSIDKFNNGTTPNTNKMIMLVT